MITYNDAWLAHHGVQGQKWGVRRYQNADGSLTPKGKARMGAEYITELHEKRWDA